MFSRSSRSFLIVVSCLLAAPRASTAADLVLVRNNSITSTDPATPPIASLFDPLTGALLGEQLPQTDAYSFYEESVARPTDGPLVLYQLNDPNQTMFISKLDDKLSLTSFRGQCRTVDGAEIAEVVNTIPSLAVERDHAAALYGVNAYPGGVICEDLLGILSAETSPVSLDPDNALALLFIRDEVDQPMSYIQIQRPHIFDQFNVSSGGVRYDETIPEAPTYFALDSNGNLALASPESLSAATTCEEAGTQYHDCLSRSAEWRAFADDLATRNLAPKVLLRACWAANTSPTAAFKCAGVAGIGFSALLVSGVAGLDFCKSFLPAQATCPSPPGGSPECLAGATCNLDFGHGHPYCTYATTGPGTCTSPRDCGGLPYCRSGRCWTDPAPPETCDNYDNDCDQVVDGFSTSCGVGACQSAGSCTAGVASCTPGTPAQNDATCNAIDDDCDGTVDEDYLATPTTCGLGACSSAGQLVCTAGVVRDTCRVGSPTREICDGIDNDCDGTVDENPSVLCDDQNACTADSCDPALGCRQIPILGCNSPCDQALTLDGTGYIEIPDAPALNFLGDFTIEFWASAATTSEFPGVVKWNDVGANNREYFLTVRDAQWSVPNSRFTWFDSNNYWAGGILGPQMPIGEWHHYAGVRDSGMNYLYIDGVVVGSQSVAGAAPGVIHHPEPLSFGSGLLYGLGRYYAVGQMDDVMLWSVGRTQAQIQADMAGPTTAPLPGLVGYWNFDEASGAALDYSGSGNSGTFVGGAARSACRATGCVDGTREGFNDAAAYPSVAACAGTWTGQIAAASAASLCAAGWHVCSPAGDVNDAPLLKQITHAEAVSFQGCFPYNAAHDNGFCSTCTGSPFDDDMGGVGAGCAYQNPGYNTSCLADQRIDADCCGAYTTTHACKQNQDAPYTGVLCCGS